MICLGNTTGGASAYVAFQVRVNPELKERLARRSLETGTSQRVIVTEALKCYLSGSLSAKFGDKPRQGK